MWNALHPTVFKKFASKRLTQPDPALADQFSFAQNIDLLANIERSLRSKELYLICPRHPHVFQMRKSVTMIGRLPGDGDDRVER